MNNEVFDAKMPKLNALKMSLTGARMLATAILLKAAEDYFYVCDQPDSISETTLKKYKNDPCTPIPALRTKGMIELFFKSELFDAISDIPPDVFRNGIKKLKASGNKFPTASSFEVANRKSAAKLPQAFINGKRRSKKEHSKF